MALSRFTTNNPITFRWLLFLTTFALFISATINLWTGSAVLAIVEYMVTVLCFCMFYFFKRWISDKNIAPLSFIFSNLIFALLIYGTTVDDVSITIYLWLSVIPFASYLLNGVFIGFLLTCFYFCILAITFLTHFDNYAHQITADSLFNLIASVIVLWILTHSYAVFNFDAKKQLIEKAIKDSLTKLNNRHAFYEFFEINKNKTKSLMIIDLDFFKKVNDTYGHDAGDYILQTVAQIFLEQVSDEETVFRLGGEEFAVLLPEMELQQAINIAHKINETVKDYEFLYHNQSIKVTASIGMAYSKSADLNELMRKADTCLYQAKNNGRDCVVIDENSLA